MSKTPEGSHPPEVIDGCIAFDDDWQSPVITEQYAYACLKEKVYAYDGVLYVAFPWASLFDGLARETALGDKLSAELDKIALGLEAYEFRKVVTVCQHIKFRDHLEYFKKVKITDLFCSHRVKGEHFLDGMNLHPFQIFPVQAYEMNKKALGIDDVSIPFEEKAYLYSFVGAYDSRFYLTGSRKLILEELKDEASYITERMQWHFEQRVYDEQVYAKNLSESQVSEETRDAIEYIEVLKTSKFSLCPSGTGPNSIRLWESIEYGSIPVILSDTLALPGDKELWEKACVFVPEDEASIKKIPDILTRIVGNKSLLQEKLDALSLLRTQLGLGRFTDSIEKLAHQYALDKIGKKFFLDTRYLVWDEVVRWLSFLDRVCQIAECSAVVYLINSQGVDREKSHYGHIEVDYLDMAFMDFSDDFVCLFDSRTLSSKVLDAFETIHIKPSCAPGAINSDIYHELDRDISSHETEEHLWYPACSIITSMYDGDRHIDGFLENLATFEGIDDFETFIVRPGSPGKEHPKLIDFGLDRPGSVYIWLAEDPGLYDVWNRCVRLSTARYCTNANIDDRRGPTHITELVKALDVQVEADVGSTAIRVTDEEGLSWEKSDDCMVWYEQESAQVYDVTRLLRKDKDGKYVSNNIPHCMPVWRTSLHASNGYFDEQGFGPSADWEFWLRCGRNGTRFYLHDDDLGLYYRAPASYWRRNAHARDFDQRILSYYTDPEKGFRPQWPVLPDSSRIDEIVRALRVQDDLHFFTKSYEYFGAGPDLEESPRLFRLIGLIGSRYLGLEIDTFLRITDDVRITYGLANSSLYGFISSCLRDADISDSAVRKSYFRCANEIETRYDDGTGLLLKALIHEKREEVDLERRYLNLAYKKDPKGFWVNVNKVYALKYSLSHYLSVLDDVMQKSSLSWISKDTKIVYYPDYSHANPYQDLLYKDFVRHGIEVKGIKRVTSDLYDEQGLKAGDVFHLHWVNTLFHKRPVEEHQKIADGFLTDLKRLKMKGIVLIWTVHNKYTHDVVDIEMERVFRTRLSLLVDRVLIHHPMIVDDIGSWLSPSATVKVVEHGNYIGSYTNTMTKEQARGVLRIDKDDLVVTIVGQIREYKEMSEKVIALGELAKTEPRFRLIVAGKVSCKKTIEALEGFPPENLVFVNGFIKDDDLQLYVNAGDLILLSYRDILTSGTLFEAMSFGRAVLAPALGSISYYVADHINGLLYENTDDLVELVRRLSRSHYSRSDEMGVNASASARQLQWPRLKL